MDRPPRVGLPGRPSVQKNLLGVFLAKFLRAEDLLQADLCRRLDIAPPQLAQWLSGHNSIPHPHLISIKEALRLENDDFTVMCYLNNIVVLRSSLERILTGGRSRRKLGDPAASLKEGLAAYVRGGRSVFEEILRYSEKRAEEDLVVFPRMHWTEAFCSQINTAVQVAKDIDQFIKEESAEVLSPRNIMAHLRYPYNYHLGFYLKEISFLEIPEVRALQMLLWESISQGARYLGNDDMLLNRIAQHATHLINRYGSAVANNNLPFPKKMDLETRRMALFGDVYRNEDRGDFGKLLHPMNTNHEFANLVVMFDGLHYGDFSRHKSLDSDRPPTKAFMRHLIGLGSEKAFIRNLSAVRLNLSLERYAERMRATRSFILDVGAARERIVEDNITEPAVAAALDKVDALLISMKREGQ